MPKIPLGSWACLFPLPFEQRKRAVWHTLIEKYEGEGDALLAQLRLSLEISPKGIPADKSILFPTLHSLPCSPDGGTDITRSRYRYPEELSH
jgi:hypothetical protein